MRCALAILVLAGSATTASPRVVMRPPEPVVQHCSKVAGWDALTKCIGKLGKVQVVKKLPAAAVVLFDAPSGAGRGLYLYIQNASADWVLSGTYERGFEQFEVLKLEPVTFGKRTIYRLAIGESVHSYVSLDDVTSAPAIVRDKVSMYCDGANRYSCMQITTDCDVYVNGKVYWTVHGTVSIEGHVLHVNGDRSLQGSYCVIPEQIDLSFSGEELE